MKKPLHFLGACMGLGAQVQTTAEGPYCLLKSLEFANFVDLCQHPVTHSLMHICKKPSVKETLSNFNTELCKEVLFYLKQNIMPIVIGGDHSVAIGTWFANINHLNTKGKELGLIWIDAHMDAHTFESSPSKAYHGMPLASLLGYGPALIKEHDNLQKLLPENLILIATRCYEKAEEQFLLEHNVRVHYMQEVSKEGFAKVLSNAFNDLKKKNLEIGISFDFDAIDPIHAPGVGSQASKGLCKKEFLEGFAQIDVLQDLVCLELVEYNPTLDENSKTKDLALEILHKLLLSKHDLTRR
ncbi:MAG: Arginase [Chlamydiia bacterium]|nr:Arginase [Chlamydiia bacterium]